MEIKVLFYFIVAFKESKEHFVGYVASPPYTLTRIIKNYERENKPKHFH